MHSNEDQLKGECTCGEIGYRLCAMPMIVHCCHCRWCQRESGSAFVINALVETDNVKTTRGAVVLVETPSNSGQGQKIARCPTCHVALWSHYAYPGIGNRMCFVRVGTLLEPNRLPPDIHIYTKSKQAWVSIPSDARSVSQFYKASEVWPATSLKRRRSLLSIQRPFQGHCDGESCSTKRNQKI